MLINVTFSQILAILSIFGNFLNSGHSPHEIKFMTFCKLFLNYNDLVKVTFGDLKSLESNFRDVGKVTFPERLKVVSAQGQVF